MHFQTAKIGFKQFIPPRTQIKVNVITCCAQTSTSRAVGALCQYLHYINYTNIPDKERRQTSDRRGFFLILFIFKSGMSATLCINETECSHLRADW